MKKTCFNCTHFWGEIHNPNDEGDHEHNFCALHGCFLNEWHEYNDLAYADPIDLHTITNTEGLDGLVYDDLETGIANCYMFSPVDKPRFEDEWFDKHKENNDRLRKLLNEVEDEE